MMYHRVMGRSPLKSSKSLGRLLHKRRKDLGITLREVSERAAELGDRVPPSTLARIEQGEKDPGVLRLHLLLRVYDLSPLLVAEWTELETLAAELPADDVPLKSLFDEGVKFWREGKTPRAIANLMLVWERVPADAQSRILRQRALLTLAVFARNLGKFRLAQHMVTEVLCEPPDASLKVRALVLASSVWRILGSLDMAVALVREASTHAKPDDSESYAYVLHQEAKTLQEAGRPKDADKSLEHALRHYRRLKDSFGETKALILRTNVLKQLDQPRKAMACARNALDLAEKHKHGALAIFAHFELGRLLVSSDKEKEGIEELNRGLAAAVTLNQPAEEFKAHYHLWKAYEAMGDSERSNLEFKAAEYHVKFADEFSPEADEVRRATRGHSEKAPSRASSA